MHVRVSSVSVEEASEKVHGDNVAFIDVRSEGEYATGHAQGAKNIPLNNLVNQAESLTGYDAVYLICQSGGRSAMAVQYLAMEGINAINVLGGTNAWQSAGLMME
jgi:rhodanese-related sulfurtransferase